jgi:hypothetical protein
MPARPSHIPHNLERTTLQKMNASEVLLARQLYPAGQVTLGGMIAKGWIEKQMDTNRGARYRITAARSGIEGENSRRPLKTLMQSSRNPAR